MAMVCPLISCGAHVLQSLGTFECFSLSQAGVAVLPSQLFCKCIHMCLSMYVCVCGGGVCACAPRVQIRLTTASPADNAPVALVRPICCDWVLLSYFIMWDFYCGWGGNGTELSTCPSNVRRGPWPCDPWPHTLTFAMPGLYVFSWK